MVSGIQVRLVRPPRQSFYFILSLPLLLSKGPHHVRESVGRRKSSQLSVALTAPRLRNPSPREQVCCRLTVDFVEDIGNAFKGGVNVCQRRLVNEVLEGATPSQRGSKASLLHRGQAIKLISHRRSDFYPEAQIRQMAVQKSAGCCPKNAKSNHRSALNITPQTADQRAPDAGRAGEPRTRKAAMKRCSRKRQETLTGLSPSCGVA